jgi:hypothetical protein
MFGRPSRRAADHSSPPAPPPVPEEVERTVPRRAAAPRPEPAAGSAPDSAVVLDGRYRLGRPLGSGGEASVHLARDLVLERDVAVKLFHRSTRSETETGLRALEARVVASLNHSALTTLLDAGVVRSREHEEQTYLVMEYVQGESLRDRLRRGPLEVSEAGWLGFDLAEGLDHMHQAGFIHRDVKPANILISGLRSARPVVAKLTDFGIAAPIGQADISEFTVGTAAYLSPEQVEGFDAVAESDVYSLGLVLLEAITGKREFPGTVEQAAFERLSRDPRIPETIPAAVGDLLRRMTARVPGERVPLHDVAVELQQFLVDDLLRRRAVEAPAQGEQAWVPSRPTSGLLGPERLSIAMRLVCHAVHVPRSLLVLGGDGRAMVEAHRGWPQAPDVARIRRPAGVPAHAAWVITGHEPDAGGAADADVRAVAAAPLVGDRNELVGTLYAVDSTAREFSPDELGALTDIALLLMQAIGLQTAVRRVLGRGE